MKSPLRILAVDDHQLFLKGLSDCLKTFPLVDKVVTCTCVNEMNAALDNWVPDIIFLDLNLRDHDGFSICREIKNKYKNIFVSIMTAYDVPKFVEKAKACGAGAYFIKNTDSDVLAKFITDFMEGKIKEFYVHMPSSESPGLEIFRNDFFEQTNILSKREREIMSLLVKGFDHHEIEKSLNITYHTFKTHRTNILQKLNVKNIAELVRLSLQSDAGGINQN